MTDFFEFLRASLADRYTIERELGRGGMAVVYLAHDRQLGRAVALKVLRPELTQSIGPERFLREIRLTAALDHPHILPLLDSGRSGGSPDRGIDSAESRPDDPAPLRPAEFLYYTMPYVEGESLRDRLNREKQLPLDDALRISREVADALSYAHAHGVIHRDIKPENILLAGGHARVADFGISRAVDQAAGEALTETGLAIGTPAYMSPEQAAGSRELDGRSDLYALGCVLYEMLAGQPPFTGPTVESLVHQHLAAEPPNITSIRPAVPASVAAALQRALAKTPADRFNPVAQFGEALREPVAAPPPAPVARRVPWLRPALLGVLAVAAIAAAVAAGRWLRPHAAVSRHPRTAVAVLPFENLSAEGPYAYFASGLHDELLTQLAKVASLSLRGRTSVMGYAGTTKSIGEVADELSVGTIVEGSVQVVGERLRVNVQLIDAATDAHLWAETYDRTLDDAFAIQSDIAQQIVAAVGATLAGAERTAIVEAPTASAEAYRLYMQGQEYRRRPGALRTDLESAQQLFEAALAQDSSFALARAALSAIHGLMYWLRYDPDPTRVARQEAEARAALREAPDLPQAHGAMGMTYYWGRRDYRRALEELRTTVAGLPGDAEVWGIIAAVDRRLGNWAEALAAYDKATEFDPRQAQFAYDQGGLTYFQLHRYVEAAAAFDRAATLAPDFHTARIMKGWVGVVSDGQLDTLRAVLGALPGRTDPLGPELGNGLAQAAEFALLERDPTALIALMAESPDFVLDVQMWPYLPASLYLAWAHELAGDTAAARASFEDARRNLEAASRRLPDDWRVHAGLGMALAGLGQREAALREARALRQSVEYNRDALLHGVVAEARAAILARAGDVGPALEEIESLLTGPSRLSAHMLHLDPRWDPIRSDPRFQALLVKYAHPEPVQLAAGR